MVFTRSRKRQAAATALANNNGANETDGPLMDKDEAENLLEEAETSMKLTKKQKRQEAWARKHPPFENLLPELLPKIMLYLSDPQTIYALSKCSKTLREAVTSEVVIRAAVFAGGKSREVMTTVMELVQKEAIFPPTVPRMLRLVLAKQCERMEDCYAYDLEAKKPQVIAKKQSAVRPFGLAICQCCSGAISAGISWTQMNNSALRDLDFMGGQAWAVVRNPQTEHATGNPIGPLLIYKEVKQMLSTNWHGSSMQEIKDKQTVYLKSCHTKAMEDVDSEFSEKIVNQYLRAQSEYDHFQAAKTELEAAKALAKRSVVVDRKKANVAKIVQLLKDELQENPHLSLIFDGEYDEHYGIFQFRVGPSGFFLSKLVNAPSQATKKRVKECAQEVGEFFLLMNQQGFLPGGNRFLHTLADNRDSCAKALYRFCMGKEQELIFRRNLQSSYHDSDPYDRFRHFIDSLRDGAVSRAVFDLLNCEDIKTAFANYVTRNVSDLAKRAQLHRLAKNVVRRQCNTWHRSSWTFAKVQRSFAAYGPMSISFRGYLRHPATVAFLAEAEDNGNPNFTRQDAIDSVLDLNGTQESLLFSRAYDDLIMRARQCYRAGGVLYYG